MLSQADESTPSEPVAADDPTDQELLAFADSMFAHIGEQFREPAVLEQAIRDSRDLWVMLYRLNLEHESGED